MSNVTHLSSALKARKAVVLARVSSKEQEDGYSIDAQKHRLEAYCLRRDLKIIETFEITESSTKGDRRKFMAMIKFIKAQKEPIALVADKVDRVQRSFKEYPLLDELINAGKIELHFNTENYVIHKDSVSQERLMWSMGVIMAQSYVDSMRDNVKRSINQKIRQGEWIAAAPIGYLNVKNEKGKSTVVIDPDRALLIRRLFQDYSKGCFTLSEMAQKTKDWGLRNKGGKKSFLSRSHIHTILHNPFYCGQMRIKGEVYPHCYEPLISKDLFNQCQAILDGWHKKPFNKSKREYVFRGLITCRASGRTVSSDTKKKTFKNGRTGEWTYLICANPENPDKKQWVREEKVIAQVEDVFKALHIPQSILKDIETYLRKTDHVERAFRKRQMSDLQKEHTKIANRIDALIDLRLDDGIDHHEYLAKKAALHDTQDDLDALIKGNRAGDDGFKTALLTLMDLSANAHKIFKASKTAQKRLLINFVFSNLKMEGEKLHYSLKKPFDQFINMRNYQEWRALVDKFRSQHSSRKFIIEQCIQLTEEKAHTSYISDEVASTRNDIYDNLIP